MIEKLTEGDACPVAGIVILEFHAEWCVPCKIMEPVFNELSEELSDVTFLKVNADENPTLVSKFKILSVPTFIILKDGKEAKRLTGIQDKDELRTALQELKS